MPCPVDGQVFRLPTAPQLGRLIAYNCGLGHCLEVDEAGRQTFRLQAGDTNSSVAHDPGQLKVRTMAAPYELNPGAVGVMPALVPSFFEARFLIKGTPARMGYADPRIDFWFVLSQIQRIPDAGDKPTSPPVALQIVNRNGMEYFQAVVSHAAAPGGEKIGPANVIVPRNNGFKVRKDYVDAKGGPNGRLRIVVTEDGKAPRTICDYAGVTGFDDVRDVYAGWGIYAKDRWTARQLPLVVQVEAIAWGATPAP